MKWIPSECERGDMIRVKLGSVYHYGIFSSEEEVIAFGLPPLPQYRENGEEIRVLATTIDVFSCGEIVEKAVFDRRERKKAFPKEKTLSLAKSRIGEGGYNLIHNNCEHFVYECVFGVSRSTVEEEMRARYRSRPVFDLYLMPLENQLPQTEIFPEKRRREIESCAEAAEKERKAAVWRLLLFAQKQSFGYPEEELRFRKSFFGKWTCNRFFFSLALCGGSAAALVSNAAAGLDLETSEHFKNSEKAAPFLKSYVGEDPESALKEYAKRQAIYKCSGKGRFSPRKEYSRAQDAVFLQLPEFPGLTLCACGAHVRSLRVFLIEAGSQKRLKPVIL